MINNLYFQVFVISVIVAAFHIEWFLVMSSPFPRREEFGRPRIKYGTSGCVKSVYRIIPMAKGSNVPNQTKILDTVAGGMLPLPWWGG